MIIAKYLRSQNKTDKDIRNTLDRYMKLSFKDYNSVLWANTLDKVVRTSKKRKLINIDKIDLTESELNTVSQIDSKPCQRLLFTMLCFAKFFNIVNPNNNGWVNYNLKKIYSIARVQCNCRRHGEYERFLIQSGFLSESNKIDNVNLKVTFINDNSKVVLSVSDFRELGYEWELYNGSNQIIHCVDCDRLIKKNKYNNQTKRCKECQHKHLQQLWRESKRRQRMS